MDECSDYLSFLVCFQITYFCWGMIVEKGACEWEHEDGNFFKMYDSNDKIFHIHIEASTTGMIICFIVCFQTTYFFVGHGKCSDNMFLLGWEHKDGIWAIIFGWSTFKKGFSSYD